MEYLDKLSRTLTSKSASMSIGTVSKTKRVRIAEIVTGLYLIANQQYRDMLSIDDATYTTIRTQLLTNPTAVAAVVRSAKRLPSKLQTNVVIIQRYEQLPPATRQLFIKHLHKIHDKLGAGS